MNDRITRAEVFTIRVPLPCIVFLGKHRIAEREFAIAVIESSNGTRGWGHTFTRGNPVAALAREHFLPLLLGEDAGLTERLWQKMTGAAFVLESEALAMRAISILDIALWDWKARRANMPLYRLLGGVANKVPVLVPCGYRRENDPRHTLSREVEQYLADGITAVKMMYTAEEIQAQAGEINRLRKSLSTEVFLGNDFYSTGASAAELLDALEAVKEAGLDFVEDPFPLSARDEFTAFRRDWKGALVTGENVSTLSEARDLCESGWINAARFDATVCGGVTAWMRMRALAAAKQQPVWPHSFPEIHAHLAAATGEPFVESSLPVFETVRFADVLETPLPIRDGHYELPDRPGLGLDLNFGKIEALRVH